LKQPECSEINVKQRLKRAVIGDKVARLKEQKLDVLIDSMHCLTNTLTAEAGLHLPTPEEWNVELVGLGTTTVSKQSAQDHYVTDIAIVSYSDHHASLGK